MDKAERRERALARLYELYEASSADLDRRILGRDSTYSRTPADGNWPRPFTREAFQSYLSGPVRDSEIRERLVKRVLLFAPEEERDSLRQALGEILSQRIRFDGELEAANAPHYRAVSTVKPRKFPLPPQS